MDSQNAFDTDEIARHAATFTEDRFRAEFSAIVEKTRKEIAARK